MIKMIICTDLKGAIGCEGKLLAHYKEDMQYFSKQTTNQIVLMGNTTFKSLQDLGMPRGLPNRKNVVLSRHPRKSYPLQEGGVTYLSSIESLTTGLVDLYTKGFVKEDIWIIGGAQIYKQFAHLVDEVHWSKINTAFPEADTFMDMEWVENEKVFDKVSTTPLCKDVSVGVYKRK